MYIGVVSMRYAKALLAYADDAKVEDAVYREALLLKDSFMRKFPSCGRLWTILYWRPM